MSSQVDEGNIENIYNKLIQKINILKKIKTKSTTKNLFYNRLISECIFWALSIIEENNNSLEIINEKFIADLVIFVNKNKDSFKMDRSSFAKELQKRYTVLGDYFAKKLNISFDDYLITTSEFKKENKLNKNVKNPEQKETSFDDLRINKPEPSSITIVDICRQMERQRFLIRPPYQREEVKNRNKSSAIIESILLGIKLPPIFVYKRKDGVSEVLDGQQRLLSILGFLKKEYLDEKGNKQKSNKHGYSLSLNNGILNDLHGCNVDKLTSEQVKKINNFDLWIIEINSRYNKDFEPIDLFLRLNSKPYPIKENTFEMWNSYIDKDIIESIKSTMSDNINWFYFRKNNKRMENENIYTAFTYLQYYQDNCDSLDFKPLEYYKIGEKINFRLKSKTDVTKILEDVKNKENLIKACNDLSEVFIYKVKSIVEDDSVNRIDVLNKNFEKICNVSTSGRRTQQSFYALWFFVSKISIQSIEKNKISIREDLHALFQLMNFVKSKESFERKIKSFWKKYQ
ncbi:DUF262 domain-containing protein [Aureivirga sp. CE67]|uniref:DUF262 domain-containing protein n=1 Tax=Aureivirga sp. CE67 TaxID=1788983 RepID=UPI0018CAED34|nr:DUF262 domain-containing protein [Aureivirga sp. CE67]